MKFWNKYISALKRANVGSSTKLEKAILKNPLCIFFLSIVLITFVGIMLWNAVTYVPPPPDTTPTMTIFGFFDFLQNWQLPAVLWFIIFILLWLTKW